MTYDQRLSNTVLLAHTALCTRMQIVILPWKSHFCTTGNLQHLVLSKAPSSIILVNLQLQKSAHKMSDLVILHIWNDPFIWAVLTTGHHVNE